MSSSLPYRRQKRVLLAHDEPLLLREAEVGGAFRIGPQPRAVGLVGGEAVERNQSIADGVGSFMRQSEADDVAAALPDDGQPAPRVLLERIALERSIW